ncbi:hypothetical protein NKR23_g121 [Pleurostoma richardsiae]|uniref:Uncharacterized protein n=1 Tax=Pleurostoma richardsiae TaxID=41990 RepID=A0AA38SFR0_9PEZI|nr:hypothetical protein NKR23_g121 [Pleurostoma richardsiae]
MAPPPPPLSDEPELDVVETPTSPTSGLALCRFEFETGKGNEGTKILMVEWDAAASVGSGDGDCGGGGGGGGGAGGADQQNDEDAEWDVSWEGKTTALPIRDSDPPGPGSETIRRMYFLLPPGAPIPTLVMISKKDASSSSSSSPPRPPLRTKPLPAIFPPSLAGEAAREAGTRGVLHAIWARRRLRELEAEMAAEMRANSESIGLEMAAQERQWIVDHFGLTIDTSSAGAIPVAPLGLDAAWAPASPRSPVAGRLGEKLRGLKLATSPAELAAATEASTNSRRAQRQMASSSSEAGGDVGVSASAQLRGRTASSTPGVASLDAVIDDAAKGSKEDNPDTEEDLFALPMSPRSPEMAKSPFSLL